MEAWDLVNPRKKGSVGGATMIKKKSIKKLKKHKKLSTFVFGCVGKSANRFKEGIF